MELFKEGRVHINSSNANGSSTKKQTKRNSIEKNRKHIQNTVERFSRQTDM